MHTQTEMVVKVDTQDLSKLWVLLGVTDKWEVLREGFTILKWAVMEIVKKRKICSIDAMGNVTVLRMESLERIRAS